MKKTLSQLRKEIVTRVKEFRRLGKASEKLVPRKTQVNYAAAYTVKRS
jgi:hypothetical protein